MESGRLDEKLILMYIPYALARVELSKNLTLEELREYKKQSSDFFSYVKGHSLAEHVELLKSHRDDTYFGQYIEKMLSESGLAWLNVNYQLMRQIAEEGK